MGREIELPAKSAIDDGVYMEIAELAQEDKVAVGTEEKAEPAANAEPAPAPEVPPAENDAEEQKEATGGRDPAWVSEEPTATFDFGKPIMGQGTHKMPKWLLEYLRGAGVGTLNQPLEQTLIRYNAEGYDAEDFEKNYEHIFPFAWPITSAHDRLSKKGSIWTNDVVAEGLSTKAAGVRPVGTDVLSIFRTQNSLGQATEWTFYNTGIVIRMRPALDSELVGLEQTMSMDRTLMGQNTWGAVLGTDMGVHLNHLIDFALGLVTWTNLAHEGDMRTALRQRLRGRESIDVLLTAVMASLYPHGYPWELHCHAGNCRATEAIDVFFARAQITDKSLLTEKHLNILHRNRQSLTVERYEEYLNELPNATLDVEHNGSVFKLRLPSIGDYAYATRRWITVTETEHATALEQFDNPVHRTNYLDAQASARTLLTISHYIGSITVENGGTITEITDRTKIEEILHAGSGDLELVAKLTQHAAEFEVDSRTTFIGHDNKVCDTCGASIREGEGLWASVVMLPMERIFFTHTRRKIQILHGLRERQ